MDSRRRVPRHVAGWTGSCHIDDESIDRVWECQVLDISELGLAISLQHPLGTQLIGRRVSVESPTASTSVNIRLEGPCGTRSLSATMPFDWVLSSSVSLSSSRLSCGPSGS
jgi:hypothetical protein